VEEIVRRMTALLVTGLFGLFMTLVGTVLGYRLGLKKTRNEQQAEVLIELRRKYLRLKDRFLDFSVPLPPGKDRLEQINAMQADIDDMVDYFHSERMYLEAETTEKARWITGGFLKHFWDMREALRGDAVQLPTEGPYREDLARHEMEQWREGDLPGLLEGLEDEIRELLGTRETLWDVVRELLGRRG
jgi:hypothetical protein